MFHPDTQIEMANGGTKSICKIRVGDEIKGGLVLATLRDASTEFYWYGGILVTGKHGVMEDGKWIRVENSKNARHFKYLTEVCCDLIADQHSVWANGFEFADEQVKI
jgi:hypothetical protein